MFLFKIEEGDCEQLQVSFSPLFLCIAGLSFVGPLRQRQSPTWSLGHESTAPDHRIQVHAQSRFDR